MQRCCEARINLSALQANAALARRQAPESRLLCVVKADAYGHGAVEVARALESEADALAVALVDEARALREAGIRARIVVLEGSHDPEAARYAAANEVDLVVHCHEQVQQLAALTLPEALNVWLKVDTGMHRLGLMPADVKKAALTLEASEAVGQLVVCTHLARADEPREAMTEQQLQVFEDATAGLDFPQSIANSAGILAWPAAHRDWNRPGYMLYGNSPFAEEHPAAEQLRPVMTLVSEVIAIRSVEVGETVGYGGRWKARSPARIATIAIGYGDGYPRHAANGTPVLIEGQPAPLAGTVSMDMITVDVTGLPDVAAGAEVVLWGPELSVNEIAQHSGTIGYELLTGVTSRVPRTYEF